MIEIKKQPEAGNPLIKNEGSRKIETKGASGNEVESSLETSREGGDST